MRVRGTNLLNTQKMLHTEINLKDIYLFTDLTNNLALTTTSKVVYEIQMTTDTWITQFSLVSTGTGVKAYIVISGASQTIYIPSKSVNQQGVDITTSTNFEMPQGFGKLIPRTARVILVASGDAGSGIQMSMIGFSD